MFRWKAVDVMSSVWCLLTWHLRLLTALCLLCFAGALVVQVLGGIWYFPAPFALSRRPMLPC